MYKVHLFNTQSEQDAIYYSALTPTSESIIKKDKVFDETVYFEWNGDYGKTVTSAGTMFEVDSDTFVEGNSYCVDFNGESVLCRAVDDDGDLFLKTEDNKEVGSVYMDDVPCFAIWLEPESYCYFSGMTSANTPSTLPLVIYNAEVDGSKVYTKPWVSMVRENRIVTFNKPPVWLSVTIIFDEGLLTRVFPNIKKVGTPNATVEIYSYEIGGGNFDYLRVVGAEGCSVNDVDSSRDSMILSLSNITDNVMITLEEIAV